LQALFVSVEIRPNPFPGDGRTSGTATGAPANPKGRSEAEDRSGGLICKRSDREERCKAARGNQFDAMVLRGRRPFQVDRQIA
jgi:hypothetical protein